MRANTDPRWSSSDKDVSETANLEATSRSDHPSDDQFVLLVVKPYRARTIAYQVSKAYHHAWIANQRLPVARFDCLCWRKVSISHSQRREIPSAPSVFSWKVIEGRSQKLTFLKSSRTTLNFENWVANVIIGTSRFIRDASSIEDGETGCVQYMGFQNKGLRKSILLSIFLQ